MTITIMQNSPAQLSTLIDGVYTVPIRTFHDARGAFMETFRREWFPWVNWEKMQSNRSDSKANVLRGLHFHRHQIDYWYVPKGIVRAVMVDLRASSPTYRAVQIIELGEENNTGVFIPEGVAHGFLALTAATLTYIVNNYYDGKDEFGVAWNDPDLNIDWGVESPVISGRDAANPRFADIPQADIPE